MTEELLGADETRGDVGRSEQAVVADLEELVRQDVEEEAADELLGRERAGVLAAGAKDDALVGDGDEARGGDGDAVRVAAEVAYDLGGTAEGLLGEHDPVVALRLAHERPRLAFGEIDRACLTEVDEAFEELAAEDPGEGSDGEEEVGIRCVDPPTGVGAQAAGCNDRMQVGVEEHLATPGVQDEGKGWLRSEPFRIGGEGEQGLRDGAKKEVEKIAAMRVHDGAQDGRQGEDDVEVGSGEEAALALLDPAVLGRALAGGAMAVETGVVEHDLAAACLAAVEVSAEGGGAAALEVAQNARRSAGERVLVAIGLGEAAEELRDFERRTRCRVRVHLRRGLDLGGDRVEGRAGGGDRRGADVDVAHGAADVCVPEQDLDDAQIGAGLEAVG